MAKIPSKVKIDKEKVLDSFLDQIFIENRKSRRWSVIFKSLTFLYLFILLFIFLSKPADKTTASGDFTALVKLNGMISAETELNANDAIKSIGKAMKHQGTKGLILSINSPGGSPVQSSMINNEIKRQRQIHPDIPIKVVVEDVCASGGYYIAVAADDIYANPSSIVGSIGVLMNGFGFDKAIEKLGIERRLLTAGENKGILDPFQPIEDEQKIHVQNLLDEVHVQFINVVKEGRGDRLTGDETKIFSGLFWNGESALKLGLIDGFGTVSSVARDEIGFEKVVDFTTYETFADRFAKKIGAGIGHVINTNSFANKFQLN
jgi:protease-4